MLKGETVFSGAPHPGTELMVLKSAAGYYLGFLDKDDFPYSRESEYFVTGEAAKRALDLFNATPEEERPFLTFIRSDEFNG
jgi:hypothetical protein